MYLLLMLSVVASGPLLYIVVALSGKRADTYERFHYGGRTVSHGEFVSTTVAYALQVAVFTLFATWGYEFGFWTIWVPVFWAAGYWLLAFLVDSGRVDFFLRQEKVGTLHSFLASRYKVKWLAVLAALASLLGITGPAMYEAWFVGNTITRLIADAGSPTDPATFITQYTILFFVCFVAMAAAYMLSGGFTAIVSTDSFQLAIGYGVFSIVLGRLLYQIGHDGNPLPAAILTTLLLVISLALLAFWLRTFRHAKRTADWYLSASTLSLGTLIYAVVLTLLLVTPREPTQSAISTETWILFASENKLGHPFGMGLVMLLNLLVANALYQLADIGQWQRLAAVQYDAAVREKSRRTIAKAIRVTMAYSSMTWIVAIVFGMCLRYLKADTATDPYDAIAKFLLHYQQFEGVWGQAIVLLMLLAFVAVMLSTLDSLVASIGFTIHNDWLLPLGERFKGVGVARAVTSVLLVLACGGYLLASEYVTNFAEILYACWSMQIALVWIVILSLRKSGPRISGVVAIVSLAAGMLGAIAPFVLKGQFSTYTHGAIFAFGASGIVAIIGLALASQRDRGGQSHVDN